MKSYKQIQLIRKLGAVLNFQDHSLGNLLKQKNYILNSIEQNSCICIKNVYFNPEEIFTFTKKLWNETVYLPKQFTMQNQQPDFPQVARVGNVLPDGSLKEAQKEAAYWHSDGDFWGEGRKHIFNCLLSVQQPYSGGQTHVMDMVAGAAYLRQKHHHLYKRLKQLWIVLNIEKIYAFQKYNAKNVLDVQTVTKHQIIKPFGTEEVLFLSGLEFEEKNTGKIPTDITLQQVQQILQKQLGYYSHKWQHGDLLIWDNTLTLHRACGYYEGRRVLYRTQGRISQNHKKQNAESI